ncbi:MAG: DNA/RNA nuclease SfsA [Prolixibacteraceae bacterium]|jgi:sugar fermentation stimulation protein A|nr:DNA/RNA nuclease SfsA [Prolixibacteraceae bacterium]
MRFENRLVKGKLIKRYKRFLADVELDDGVVVTAHCTNSGSMKSCIENGADVYLSPVDNPKRKTRFTWEMIKINGDWVGINTGNPNKIAYEAIKNHEISGLDMYTEVKREVIWGDSRFDIMAENETETCFVEVKNVSMNENGVAMFPDAVTTRGRKHLETLIKLKKSGLRAAMLYIVQRSDVKEFQPADHIDPEYGKALRRAYKEGVGIFVVQAEVSPEEIVIKRKLPIILK